MPTERRWPALAPAVVACVLAATVSAGCSNGSADAGASGGSTASPGAAPADGGAATRPATPSTDASGPAGSDAAGGTDAGGTPDDGTADDNTADDGSDDGTAEGVTSGAEGPGEGAEVPGTERPLAAVLRQAARPLVVRPLPTAAQARGRLVAGFPGFLGAGPGSVVATSSLSPSGDRLQAALTGTSVQDAAGLARSFRVRLARRGLAERGTVAGADGSETVSFARGRSTVTLTVGRDAGTTTYVVHAVLHAGRD